MKGPKDSVRYNKEFFKNHVRLNKGLLYHKFVQYVFNFYFKSISNIYQLYISISIGTLRETKVFPIWGLRVLGRQTALSSTSSLREKRPNTEFFLISIFPHSECISPYLFVFSPNTGKNEPEETYLDTFHIVPKCQTNKSQRAKVKALQG